MHYRFGLPSGSAGAGAAGGPSGWITAFASWYASHRITSSWSAPPRRRVPWRRPAGACSSSRRPRSRACGGLVGSGPGDAGSWPGRTPRPVVRRGDTLAGLARSERGRVARPSRRRRTVRGRIPSSGSRYSRCRARRRVSPPCGRGRRAASSSALSGAGRILCSGFAAAAPAGTTSSKSPWREREGPSADGRGDSSSCPSQARPARRPSGRPSVSRGSEAEDCSRGGSDSERAAGGRQGSGQVIHAHQRVGVVGAELGLPQGQRLLVELERLGVSAEGVVAAGQVGHADERVGVVGAEPGLPRWPASPRHWSLSASAGDRPRAA